MLDINCILIAGLLVMTVATSETDGFKRFMASTKKYGLDVKVNKNMLDIFILLFICVCMYMYMCVCVYIYIYISVYIYLCVYVCVY